MALDLPTTSNGSTDLGNIFTVLKRSPDRTFKYTEIQKKKCAFKKINSYIALPAHIVQNPALRHFVSFAAVHLAAALDLRSPVEQL